MVLEVQIIVNKKGCILMLKEIGKTILISIIAITTYEITNVFLNKKDTKKPKVQYKNLIQ